MSATKQIPLPAPGENLVIWSAKHGRDAIELLNSLSLLEIGIVPYNSSRGRFSIVLSGESAVIGVPLQGITPITDPLANTSSNTTTIIAILNLLRTIKILPGALT